MSKKELLEQCSKLIHDKHCGSEGHWLETLMGMK